jgi:hypothetical protein
VYTEDDYMFMPEADAACPPAGIYFQRIPSAWWTFRPGKGLVFWNPPAGPGQRRHAYYGVPQCNSDEAITRKLVARGLPFPVEVRFFDLVMVPIRLSDYRQ